MGGGVIAAWLMNLGFAAGDTSAVPGVSGTTFVAVAWSNSPADAVVLANKATAIGYNNAPADAVGVEVE